MDRLKQAIESARREDRHVALVMLDIDKFKVSMTPSGTL